MKTKNSAEKLNYSELEELRMIFEEMRTSGSDGLDQFGKIAGLRLSSFRKERKITELIKYYSQEDSIGLIWKKLSKYEKELLTCYVHSSYRPLESEMAGIAEKHGVSVERHYFGDDIYISEKSKLNLIVIDGRVPQGIRRILEIIIPPMQIQFKLVEDPGSDSDEEYSGSILDRADYYGHFDMLVKFVNNEKVSATKSGGLMSKSSLLKFYNLVKYPEILYNDIKEMKDIRNINDTTISYGMVKLLLNAKVLDIHADKYILGEKVKYYVGLAPAEKAEFLYKAYVKHNNYIIDECQRIAALKYKFSRSNYDLSAAIRVITQYLALCPVMQWVGAGSFQEIIRKRNYNFLRESVGNLLVRDDYYNSYYNSPRWYEFEGYFIDIVLMEYLGVLGVVDVLTCDSGDDYGTRYFPVVEYFRLTELGAFLVGASKTYTPKNLETGAEGTGFIVQPNFEIIVPEGSQRMNHELFFERFLAKTTSDQQVTVYALNFKGIVKALDIGISIEEIYKYIETCSTVPIPNNVTVAFNDWLTQSKRIRIRTVTLLETDDAFLLEEIKNYKTIKTCATEEIRHALVIAPEHRQKVKKEIEKNGRFVDLSLN